MSDPVRPEIAAVVGRIDALRPELVAAGREGDELRRVPDATFDAVAQTGAFAISVLKLLAFGILMVWRREMRKQSTVSA